MPSLSQIKDKIKSLLKGTPLGRGSEPQKPVLERKDDPATPLTPEILNYRIRKAAQTRTLLLMKYHDTWRSVEPYSYRWKSDKTTGTKTPVFFGACRLHNGQIHAFRLSKIQGAINTDQVFTPQWAIEIA